MRDIVVAKTLDPNQLCNAQNMSRIQNFCRLFPGRKYRRSFATHIRRCVFIICKIPLFVLGINIGILVSIVKLPDEVCASHSKRVGENKKVLLHK